MELGGKYLSDVCNNFISDSSSLLCLIFSAAPDQFRAGSIHPLNPLILSIHVLSFRHLCESEVHYNKK